MLFSCIRLVSEKHVEIVETLGKYDKTLTSGLNFIWPSPISRVVKVHSLRIQEIKSEIEVKTSDNVFTSIPVSIMYQVNVAQAADAYYKLENPEEQVKRWVLTSIRAKAAEMKLEELYLDRSSIIESVEELLKTKLSEFGFRVETILIDQPMVSEVMQAAFNKVVASRREAEAAVAEADAIKIKLVAKAKGEAEAQVERATGLGKARAVIAQSYADSIKIIKDSGGNETTAMELLLTVNRLDALRDIGSHGNMMIVDMDKTVSKSDAMVAANVLKSSGNSKSDKALSFDKA